MAASTHAQAPREYDCMCYDNVSGRTTIIKTSLQHEVPTAYMHIIRNNVIAYALPLCSLVQT
jgi:hypothetical protein